MVDKALESALQAGSQRFKPVIAQIIILRNAFDGLCIVSPLVDQRLIVPRV